MELKKWFAEIGYRADPDSGEIEEIEGFASTPTLDTAGDMILPSAFADTLDEFMERGSIIYQHDWNEPVGRPLEAKITDAGLWLRARISDTQRGRDVKRLIRDGVLRELSIGFQYVDAVRWTDELAAEYGLTTTPTGYLVRAVQLYEVSLVTRAANPTARIIAYRQENPQDIGLENLTKPQDMVYSIRVPAWHRRAGGNRK